MTWGDFLFSNAQCGGYPLHLKKRNSFLALFWLLGFGLGSIMGWVSRDTFLLLLHHYVLASTSRHVLFLLLFAPIILAIIATLLRSYLFLYSIAVVEGFCFGTVLISLSFFDLSCGWLIAALLLAPKCLLLLPQYLLWSKCLTGSTLHSLVRIVLLVCVLIALAITFHQRFSSFIILLLDHL